MKKFLLSSLTAVILFGGTAFQANAATAGDSIGLSGETLQQWQDRRRGNDRRWNDRRNDRRWNDRRYGNSRRPVVRYETRVVRRGSKVYRETYRITYQNGRVKTKRVDRVRIR